MKRSLWYICCCLTLSLVSAAAAQASPQREPSKNIKPGNASNLGRVTSTNYRPTEIVAGVDRTLAQAPPPPAPPAPTALPGSVPATPTNPTIQDSRDLQNQLNTVKENPEPPKDDKFNTYQPKSSPSFSIFNPVGFGADKNLLFFSLSYQNRTRFGNTSDGEAGIGVGLGDSVNSVGVELSYGLNSFGSSSGFGSGGFNAKIHKRVGDDSAVAIGWNQFAQIQLGSGRNGSFASDYPKNSYYAVGTKIFRTRDDINEPFSRVAVTGGLGGGAFLPFDRNADPAVARGGLNAFGSVGVRIARPVSAVLEWTGQDLGAGVSIAPFDNFPLVITPAVRDITGAGDGARFILGASAAFNF